VFNINTYLLTHSLKGRWKLLSTSSTRHCCVNNKQTIVFKKENEVVIKVCPTRKALSRPCQSSCVREGWGHFRGGHLTSPVMQLEQLCRKICMFSVIYFIC